MKHIASHLSFKLACVFLSFLGQWKHCCEELMRIEIMSPRKPPLFLAKEATSVYYDMSKWVGLASSEPQSDGKATLSTPQPLILLTLKC